MRDTSVGASGLVLLALTAVGGTASSCAPIPRTETHRPAHADEIPAPHEPLHQGSVDLATGLYIRENDDLVLDGTPALVLRRTYLSRYREPCEFGIGTKHPGEDYLIGDGEQFQWAELIRARGSRIRFRRVSPGTSYLGAVFAHETTPTAWHGALLRWAGSHWELRTRDGSVVTFRPCGEGHTGPCSILQSTDPAGRTVHYRRDPDGTLVRMDDGAKRWIAFDYDERRRIMRAHDSTGREVRYEYDEQGRLARVAGSDGVVRRYGYTDLDELATIDEPGTSIENVYEEGRVIRQLNYHLERRPFVFDFTYRVENGRITSTHTRRSDGTWTEYVWDERRYSLSETRGHEGFEPIVFTYQRDPITKSVTMLTVTCLDRRGRPTRRASHVNSPGTSEQVEHVKRSLVQGCSWLQAPPTQPPDGPLPAAARQVRTSP